MKNYIFVLKNLKVNQILLLIHGLNKYKKINTLIYKYLA